MIVRQIGEIMRKGLCENFYLALWMELGCLRSTDALS